MSLLLAIGIVLLYLLPLWTAAARNCKRIAGISILNILLGWTFIGWVIAMVWAVSDDPQQKAA